MTFRAAGAVPPIVLFKPPSIPDSETTGSARDGIAQHVGSEEVAGDRVPVGLHEDSRSAKAIDHQPGNAGTTRPRAENQPIRSQPGIDAIQLDPQDRVVAVGQCVRAGPRLAVAIDDHWFHDGRQWRRGSDRLHARTGNVEIDRVVDAVRPDGRHVGVEVRPIIERGDRLTQGDDTIKSHRFRYIFRLMLLQQIHFQMMPKQKSLM